MRRKFKFVAAILTATAWGASASPLSVDSSAANGAMDPTLPGRMACRGSNLSRNVLEARLRMAQSLSESRGLGSIGLYSGVARSDLPLGQMEPAARRYFDQGLAFAYGFNHAAAIRSFRRALEIDPQCAACLWGEAMANGPNINAAMDDKMNAAALAALAKAKTLSQGRDPFVGALVDAQLVRFSSDPDADRSALDRAYARSMLAIARSHPQSDDLSVLAAESAMNTSPWNYWTADGKAVPLIAEAVELLETVMGRNPTHPQAAHLYIHLQELPDPKKAEAAADRLRGSAPMAFGHLVHMPSHIYYRTGRYADSMKSNIAAVAADEAYLREIGDDGLVRYGYYPHNVHFLLTSAQMMGDVPTIVNQTQKLKSILDTDTGRELFWVQAIYAAPYFAYAQYSSPEATLALTATPHELEYVEAMRHYARAVAYASDRDGKSFDAELAALSKLATSPAAEKMDAGGFPAPLIIRLAAEVAKGRRALAQSRSSDAIDHFSRAATMQKEIPYNEPPFWYYPVTQSLGAAYFMAGRYREADEAFRAALFEAPNNALALFGLAQTQRKLGNGAEVIAAERAFKAVWRGDRRSLDMRRL